MDRREFLAAIAAGGIVTAEGLWMPGTKLISIPKPHIVNFTVHVLLRGDRAYVYGPLVLGTDTISFRAQSFSLFYDGDVQGVPKGLHRINQGIHARQFE